MSSGHTAGIEVVSIRAPAKGAIRRRRSTHPARASVSIRAPAKGAMGLVAARRRTMSKFQSAPPRRERSLSQDGWMQAQRVSIRAPAKGAIQCFRQGGVMEPVSIRAPAKGAMISVGLTP